MANKIKVSVIVPVYNVQEYLKECLDSLLAQTLKEIEIICIDDGSTDLSPSILDEYAEKDSRMVVIHQENAGAGAARNQGIRIACGDYIGFVDSDDRVYPSMYEKLYKKAIACNADMVITGEVETLIGDNILFPIDDYEVGSRVRELDAFNAVDYPDILKNVFLWNRIYSRKFWEKYNFVIPERRKFAEDVLICTQTSVLANRIGYVKGPLYWYRNFRENSLSDTLAKSSKKLDYIVAVRETKEFLLQTQKYPALRLEFLLFVVHLFSMLQRRIAN